MNNLSIIIYLADIIPSLGGLFTFLTIVSVITMAMSGFFYLFARSELQISIDHGHQKCAARDKMNIELCSKIFRYSIVVFSIASVPDIVIPKRDTIMMIAASEFGDTVLKSDDVKEIVNPAKQILKNWINDQLAQSEKKK